MKSLKSRFNILSYSLISSLILTLSPALIQAETNYVSDRLIITVRTGAGASFQVIKAIKSGEHVEVLEKTDNGYTKVETSDGTEGWVRSQYLIEEPTAKETLAKVEVALSKTKLALKNLKQKHAALSKNHASLSKHQTKLTKDKTKLDAKFARLSEVSKKPIILDRQNRKLQHANINLEKDLQRLNQENHSLKDRSQREWFIVGALVLFIGLILGLVIPKLRGNKRSSW